jgi:thiol-disulfide isomerase/thioredoxin
MSVARRLTAVVPLTAAAIVLAACSAVGDAGVRVSTSAASDPVAIPSETAPADLVAAAKLATCPTTDSTVAALTDGLPDLTLPCLGNGPAVRLAGLRGKPTVVNLWASWCEPCRDELPLLAALSASTSGVVVVGIDIATRPDQALSLLAETGVHYASVRDDSAVTKSALHWTGIPMTLFVDADGLVTHVERPPIVSADQLRSLVSLHLGVAVSP